MKNEKLNSLGKKYYCFISYRHADKKHAKRLKREFNSYMLTKSAAADDDYRWDGRRIYPVFRDTENLPAGELDDRIKKKLKESCYLLVICSKNLIEKPDWVDREINHFRSLPTYDVNWDDDEQDPVKVILYTVDDVDNPADCYSPGIEDLNREYGELYGPHLSEYRGDSLFKYQKYHKMFLKTLSTITGIDQEVLEKQDKKARFHRLVRRIIAIIIGVLFAVFIMFMGTQSKYQKNYVDYTTVYGEPIGIGKIKREELKTMNSHYAIVKKGWKCFGKGQTVELRHENAHGVLVNYNDDEYKDRPIYATYNYSTKGVLIDETRYDSNGTATIKIRYSANANVADLSFTDIYSSGKTLISDTTSTDTGIFDNGVNKSEICRFLFDYDEHGFTLEMRYASDTYNTATSDSNGIAGIRFKRDDLGRVIFTEYIAFYSENSNELRDATKSDSYTVTTNHLGIAKKEYNYDNYDLIEVKCYNSFGEPAYTEDGWSGAKRTFSNHNAVTKDYYIGEIQMSGNEVLEYENGNLITICTYDSNNIPEIKGGFFKTEYSYDLIGRISGEYYYDADLNRTYSDNGYAGVMYTYDTQNRVTAVGYLDSDDKLTEYPFGYAEVKMEYDKSNNVIGFYYYNIDGKLTENKEGYAIAKLKYDDLGKQTAVNFYSVDDKPVISDAGYHSCHTEYYKNGMTKSIRYYGINNKPIRIALECCGCIYYYDERGRVIEINYIDSNGNLKENENGIAGYLLSYNVTGLIEKQVYINAREEPTYYNYDYSGLVFNYDEYGRANKYYFIDVSGKPMCSLDDFCQCIYKYDDFGEMIEASYYDTNGNLILNRYGFAIMKREYTYFRKVCKEMYFGVDDEPILNSTGYSILEIEYDDKYRPIKYSNYGTNGYLIEDNKGIAEEILEYDERGNITKELYYGINSNIINKSDLE